MIRRQFIRFAVIGLSVNALLYALYLLLTHTIMGSRGAMTVSYCTGVLIGFALNRRITFRFEGPGGSALLRYICAYGIGYAINFAGLWLLAERCGIPHEVVQAGMIFGIAILLFFLQKYWVFRNRRSSHSPRLTSISASP